MCGTNDNKLLIFEDGELVFEIMYVMSLETMHLNAKKPSIISAISSYSSGILIGFDTGLLVNFQKTEDGQYYKKTKEMFFEEGKISCIKWNPRNDRAIISMSSSQLYLLQIDTDTQGDHIKCDRLSQSFHCGAILGMDSCVSKPLLVTSGVDRSIRVWNYIENNIEVITYYPEQANSVSIHPNGLYLVACFPSCIKVMSILLNEIKEFWDYNTRGAKSCRFSYGGNYFAAIAGIDVIVFDTWSLEPIAALKVASARIKFLEWSTDDTTISIFCADGTIQRWGVFGWTKELEINLTSPLLSASLGNFEDTTYIYSKSGHIKELVKGKPQREMTLEEPITNSTFY